MPRNSSGQRGASGGRREARPRSGGRLAQGHPTKEWEGWDSQSFHSWVRGGRRGQDWEPGHLGAVPGFAPDGGLSDKSLHCTRPVFSCLKQEWQYLLHGLSVKDVYG